jgi:hypothetical protein
MEYTCSLDVNETTSLFCPITIACGNVKKRFDNALMDTGAVVCHITYALWCAWGCNKLCFDGNPSLMNLAGFNSFKEMTFDGLPL